MTGEMVRAILEGRKTQTRRIVSDKRLSPKLTLLELFDFLGGGGKCEGTGSSKDDEGLRLSFVRDYDRKDDNGRRYKYTGLLVQSEAVPEDGAEEITCPYGVAGDRLWVRETHYRYGEWRKNGKTKTGRQKWRFNARGKFVMFEDTVRASSRNKLKLATKRTDTAYHKRPSIFMPKWAARLWLEITKVRVERLQDISEEDAKAEGIEGRWHPNDPDCWTWKDYLRSKQFTEDMYSYGSLVTPKSVFAGLWDSINGKGAWDTNPWVWVIEYRSL